MVPGEAIAVLDGGRKGIDRDVLKSLTNSVSGRALTRVRNDYLMIYTEEGLSGRRERVRGIINQVETLSVFTFNGMVMAKRNSKHYSGSNFGNIIGPCSVMSYDDKDLWLLDPAAKKALYGPGNKTLAGGSLPDTPPRPHVEGGEPASWHLTHKHVWEEMVHNFSVKLMVQAPTLDHLMAMTCIQARTRRVFTPPCNPCLLVLRLACPGSGSASQRSIETC